MTSGPQASHKHKQAAAPLRIDTADLYTETVGAEGVSKKDLQNLESRLHQIHERLEQDSARGLEGEYACLNLHGPMLKQLDAIKRTADKIRRYPDVLIIGIGGSSLGAKAVYHALISRGQTPGSPRLHFAENIDPHTVNGFLARLNARDTAVICISKSGGTLETVAQYLVYREWLDHIVGREQARRQQWIITDPESGWLRELAQSEDIPNLDVPPRVGGRFSVLSPVGLLPLAIAGIDVGFLLQGAEYNAGRCAHSGPDNPAAEIAAAHFLLETTRNKRLSVFMPYIDRLGPFADWYRQLWAESLGKLTSAGNPAGTLPVSALGTVDQHSQLQMYLESSHDKIFTFLMLDNVEPDRKVPVDERTAEHFPYLVDRTVGDILAAEFQATRQVISEYGHPNMTIALPVLNPHSLGQLIDLLQRVTVYTGLLYGINPLDQPAVEKGKQLAVANLKKSKV